MWIAWVRNHHVSDCNRMQTNGMALLLDKFKVALPGAVDAELMQAAWGQLQRHYQGRGAELPPELVGCAPQNYAMLAYMCYERTIRRPGVSKSSCSASRGPSSCRR